MVTQYFRAHSSKWSDMSLGGVGRLGCGGQNSVPPEDVHSSSLEPVTMLSYVAKGTLQT